MSSETIEPSVKNRFLSLRVWPAILLLMAMLATKYITKLVDDGPSMLWVVAAMGPLVCSVLILIWWLAFSRARAYERLVGFLGLVLGVMVTIVLVHESMRGPAITVFTIPMGFAAFSIMLILNRNLLSVRRTWIAIICAWALFLSSTLFKSNGLWGTFAVELDWRWNKTADEQLAEQSDAPNSQAIDVVAMKESLANPVWPSLRGPHGDSTVSGLIISKDWQASPPKQLWKITVGPAWSSMVVAGNLLFTQEQRGDNECLVCYNADDGKQVWVQQNKSRFFESLGGLGPRATPTLDGDSIYCVGAEGWVQRVNAINGEQLWKSDLRQMAKREPPMWGFSSSPCIHEDLVVVYTGTAEKGIVAFYKEDGSEKWSAPCGTDSYGSVQRIEVLGKTYLSILSNTGLHLYDPADGREVLMHSWSHNGYRALQPQMVGENQILVPTGMGSGTRLVEISTQDGQLAAKELWTSRKLKPDFNDCVQHKGHLYGFDDAIFTCIGLKDGERVWKGGRYGKGQVLLLSDCDALIVQAETGELVLLDATPEGHKELGKITSMTSKSWNHPVVVGNRLYARTADEMVCYELATLKNGDQ